MTATCERCKATCEYPRHRCEGCGRFLCSMCAELYFKDLFATAYLLCRECGAEQVLTENVRIG